MVRHAATEGSYNDVVTALKKRYDKSRVVYMHHVSALTSRAPIRSTCEDVVRAFQELKLHHSSLKVHGGDMLGQYLSASMVLLMDPTCATHWADNTSSHGEPPDNSSSPSTTDQPRPQGTQVLCAKGRVVHKDFTDTFPRTTLATAMGGAYQQRSRALLDPGATISLITSRLASSLKAK